MHPINPRRRQGRQGKNTACGKAAHRTPHKRSRQDLINLFALVLARFAPGGKVLAIVENQIVIPFPQSALSPFDRQIGRIAPIVVFHLDCFACCKERLRTAQDRFAFLVMDDGAIAAVNAVVGQTTSVAMNVEVVSCSHKSGKERKI